MGIGSLKEGFQSTDRSELAIKVQTGTDEIEETSRSIPRSGRESITLPRTSPKLAESVNSVHSVISA
jgi:hypothetical protein